MVAVTAYEHLNSLLTTYQFAERIYSQMVSDADAAAFRRDEAERFKVDAFNRLQKARDKFGQAVHTVSGGEMKEIISQEKPLSESKIEIFHDSGVSMDGSERSTRKHDAENAYVDTSLAKQLIQGSPSIRLGSSSVGSREKPKASLSSREMRSIPLPIKRTIAGERSIGKVMHATPPPSPSMSKRSLDDRPVLGRSPLSEADQKLLSPRIPIRKIIAESNSGAVKGLPPPPPVTPKESPGKVMIDSHVVVQPSASVPDTTLPNKAGPSTITPRTRKKTVVALRAYSQPKPTLQITSGRSREWLEKNFNYEAFGLVKRFYQASFGTKTNEKTQKVTVRTILLTDEWNDLAKDTRMVQEMYVLKGTGESSNGLFPGQRDRAAHALVDPLQSLPIALFFSPKKALNTSDIYYVGHWKVVDGKVLDPPEMMNGQLRQTVAKFVFAGVDKNIVDAFNKET